MYLAPYVFQVLWNWLTVHIWGLGSPKGICMCIYTCIACQLYPDFGCNQTDSDRKGMKHYHEVSLLLYLSIQKLNQVALMLSKYHLPFDDQILLDQLLHVSLYLDISIPLNHH
jgi:hypothetical protein